jgi:hypothetical protein
MALAGNGKHALDKAGMLRCFQRRVPKERSDYGHPEVSGAHVIAAAVFEIVEERPDERRVQVLQRDL